MRCKTPDITSKHSQETHYNYVKNSGFCISTSTGKERDSETGFSYFGARYYDSDLMTGWLSVDPMADKYPNLSPYAYCAWNPVRLVDPDGEEIWIVNSNGDRLKYTVGMSSKGFDNYTMETINALNKLSQTKTLGIQINQLARADENRLVVNILECSGNTEFTASLYKDESKYYPPVQEILFDPYLAMEDINTNKTMSPALSLGHELMHLYNLTTDLPGFLERRNDKTRKDIWTDEEEFYNITTWEWGVANEWNELKRKSHKMTDKNGNKIYDFINVESSTLETK